MANAATPVLDASTGRAFIPVPANFGSVFLIGFTAAAALACVQGQVVPLNSSGLFINAPNFGGVPLDFCPVAYMIVKAGATASSAPGWVFGTDSNSVSTGVVYTFVDLIGMPDRPQIA
jgi:hypothetical protein